MKKFNNKSGFTLIEIIVVLIIVGILAAIALPNLFNNVAKSRAAEALTEIDSIRPNIETCIAQNLGNEATKCTFGNLFPAANLPTSPNFAYVLAGTVNGSTGYSVTATGNNAAAGGTIAIARAGAADNAAYGAMSCTPTGNLIGAC